jgi:hypothetical protein
MKTSKHEIHSSHFTKPPVMETTNEEMLTQSPHETTCYTDADVVWDSNYPRGLEVINHGNWQYGPIDKLQKGPEHGYKRPM